MAGYKLSFALGFTLIAGAFIAMFIEMSSEGPKVNASYALLIGGVALCIVGQKEYKKKNEIGRRND